MFGGAVAISEEYIVVGATWHDGPGIMSGAVYVFDEETGEELYKLVPSDLGEMDSFGCTVAIDGRWIIVGAVGHNGVGKQSGAAYVFDVSTGELVHKLAPSDATPHHAFGLSVAIDGHLAIVGARDDSELAPSGGAAYVFDVTTGEQLVKLTPSDFSGGKHFGESVSISWDRAIVGASGDGDAGLWSGAAYIFDVMTGEQLFKLTALDAAAKDMFGESVAIDGDIAIVGSRGFEPASNSAGAAYLFDVTTGEQLRKLTASDAAPGDSFGSSVAIRGGRAIVGAQTKIGDGERGAAYLFDVRTGQELAKLTASDEELDEFGCSVALGDSRTGIGSLTGPEHTGAVYIFDDLP
jgi:outer membrane protein assembly factor BamB